MCERCDEFYRNLAERAVTSYNEQAAIACPQIGGMTLEGMTPEQVRFVGSMALSIVAAAKGSKVAFQMVLGSNAVLEHIKIAQHQAATS